MPRQAYDLLYAMDGDGDIDVDNNCDDFVYSLQMQCVYGGDGKFKLQGYQPLKKAEPQISLWKRPNPKSAFKKGRTPNQPLKKAEPQISLWKRPNPKIRSAFRKGRTPKGI